MTLPTALNKTWLADTDFWGYWVFANKLTPNKSRKWVCLENEPVWGNEMAWQLLTDALDVFFKQTDLLKSNELSEKEARAGISSPLRQISLTTKDIESLKQVRPKVKSNDYVRGSFGFYTILDSRGLLGV